MKNGYKKDIQYYKFCTYGFLKNLRFYEPFLMVFLLQKLSNDYSQVGFLYSLRFIMRILLEIPSGSIADALGKKGSLLFAYTLYIGSFISYFFANNFGSLFIPTILFGVADAFRTGTHKAMIVIYLSKMGWSDHKTSYYGNTRSWSQFGSAISSLLAFIIILISSNYGTIFLFSALPYILGFINLASYPGFLNKDDNTNKLGYKKRLKQSYKESLAILTNRSKLKRLTATSLYFGYYHSLKDYLQPIILSLGLTLPFLLSGKITNNSALILPLAYFIIYLTAVIGSKKAGQFNQFIGSNARTIKLLTFIGCLSGILLAVFHELNIPAITFLLFILIFVGINVQRPSVISIISSEFPKKNMAVVLSIESQLGSLIAAILSLISGFLADAYGISFAIGVISILVLILATIHWRKKNENN